MNHTPLMSQYFKIKERFKSYILFFQVGDFFEMFHDDAILVSKLLGLTLTEKNSNPMCGIPINNKDIYVQKIIDLDYKVVICSQINTNDNSKLINRDVTEIITKGTIKNTDIHNRFILSMVFDINIYHIVY